MQKPTAVIHMIPISCQVTDLPSDNWINMALLIL